VVPRGKSQGRARDGAARSLGLGAFFFATACPPALMPDEDQGYLYVSMQLPIAASMERTSEAGKQVENVLANIPGVQYTTSVIASICSARPHQLQRFLLRYVETLA